MRTTLTLDDEAFEVAKAYARARALRLSEAVSELILQSRRVRIGVVQRNGVWVFDLPPDAPRVSAAQVRDLMDEGP